MIFFKQNFTKIILLMIAVLLVFILIKQNPTTNYSNEIMKQDLQLKCREVYEESHKRLESIRYGEYINSADAVIWSPKTRSCLAYYNVSQYYQDPSEDNSFLFEVWDYTNTDLVLSYKSYPFNDCESGFNYSSLIYKPNEKLEVSGCYLELSREGIDVLTNFEKGMLDLGFKK